MDVRWAESVGWASMTSDPSVESGAWPGIRRPLVNDPQALVSELIEGYVDSWGDYVRLSPEGQIIRTTPKERGRVGLVIGNGLGHEPAMMGLVGKGLFDVNVPGGLFSAPGPMAIAAGIRAADRGSGVLLCVSNHSGDVLSADMAMRLLADSGPECRAIRLWDDVSTSAVHGPDRRGGSGLLFVWKVVGAAAESGHSLDECERIGMKARDSVRSLGAVLGGTVNPVTGNVISPVENGTALVGAGVHGDATGEVLAVRSADEVAELLIERVVSDLHISEGDHCALIVNDAGAMSVMELALVVRACKRWLTRRGIVVDRIWSGRYATTLATAGVGVSICRLDDELRRLWDMECSAPALSIGKVHNAD